jgi:hypothetical protein
LIIGGGSALVSGRLAEAAIRCTGFNAQGVQVCEVGLERNLGAVQAQQEQSQWCWAACIAAIFRYHGHEVAQARIVAETFGRLVNAPAFGPQIAAATNRPWIDESGREFGSECEVLWDSAFHVRRPDAPAQAARELAEGNPLIIGSTGHAMVLTAMTFARDQAGNGQPTEAIVRDPWPGRGRRPLSGYEWQATQFLAKVQILGGGAGGRGAPKK